jgi:RDD family
VILGAARILEPAGDAGAAIFVSASFLMIFYYDVLFEVLGGGRTPGKRLNGLRVVRGGGRPVTLVRSALRNILRLIDILPGVYAIGMTVMFISPRNQRVGDLAAGTYVIRDRHGDRRRIREPGPMEIDPGPAATWDVTAVSQDAACARASAGRPRASPTCSSSSSSWRRSRPGPSCYRSGRWRATGHPPS